MPKHSIKIEEIGGTTLESAGGFSHVDILVAPVDNFDVIGELPPIEGDGVLATTAAAAATISTDHTFKAGFGFAKFRAEQDKNGLESPLIGDSKVHENKLTVMVKGTDADVLGNLRLLKNEKLIVLAREAHSGRYRQIGSARYAAEIIEATPTVAPEFEGANTVTFVIRDKSVVAAPIYTGAITTQPVV